METALFLWEWGKWVAKYVDRFHFKDKKQNKPVGEYHENSEWGYKHNISINFGK